VGGGAGGALPETNAELVLLTIGKASKRLHATPLGTSEALNDQNTQLESLPRARQQVAADVVFTSSRCLGLRTSTPAACWQVEAYGVGGGGGEASPDVKSESGLVNFGGEDSSLQGVPLGISLALNE
jgi:hypothetical protein